jgi:hypothetical protein
MAWNNPDPSPIVVASEGYVETRPNPDAPGKDQIRKRIVEEREYRGIIVDEVFQMLIDYPIVTSESITTRSATFLAANGFIVYETEDKVVGDWEDAPEVPGTPPQ